MDTRTRRLFILKNLIYTLALILAYILQETPGAFVIAGVRPNLVIAAVVAAAMTEGEFSGGLYGLLGGILSDTAAFHIFGAGSILFTVLGCGCGLVTNYLIRSNWRTAVLMNAVFAFIYGTVSHYLIYAMWGYDGSDMLFLTKTLPSVVYTAAFGVLFYFAAQYHDRHFKQLEK